jgi:hypothetical protein
MRGLAVTRAAPLLAIAVFWFVPDAERGTRSVTGRGLAGSGRVILERGIREAKKYARVPRYIL